MARQVRPSVYISVSQLTELKQLEERDGTHSVSFPRY